MFCKRKNLWKQKLVSFSSVTALAALLSLGACADYDVPGARTVNIPAPAAPVDKLDPINKRRDSIQHVGLSEDVLRPRVTLEDPLPNEEVGPFELRSETLAAALQLILADFDIPLAFESEEALSRRVTIANLKGDLTKVVSRVCGLVDLYCAYEDGLMIVKSEETFAVTLPPIGEELYTGISTGLQSITGSEVVVDPTTRTLLYTATHRTAERARVYFDRLRSSTALIVFETHIWEVTLSNNNDTGINWDDFVYNTGNFVFDLSKTSQNITGALGLGVNFSSPDFTIDSVIEFLASQGSVKTISQPQITLLSGSEAELTIGGSRDYVSEITRSESGDLDDLSISTSTLDTGLGMTISGYLDDSTVYGNLLIETRELVELREVSAGGTQIQLPETSERSLTTQIRIRPGDALMVGGIVTERDDFASSGVGFMYPFLPWRESSATRNTELVFLLRPRVIVYETEGQEKDRIEREEKHARAKVRDIEEMTAAQHLDKVVAENVDVEPIDDVKEVRAEKAQHETTVFQPIIADLKPDFSEVTQVVSSEIQAARQDVNVANSQIYDLKATVEKLRNDVRDMKEAKVTPQPQEALPVATPQTESALEEKIQAELAGEKQKQAALMEQIDALQQQVKQADDALGEEKAAQDVAFKEAMDASKKQIEALNAKLAELESEKQSDTSKEQLSKLEQRLSSVEEDAQKARDRAAALAQEQEAKEKAIDELRQELEKARLEAEEKMAQAEAEKQQAIASAISQALNKAEAEKQQAVARAVNEAISSMEPSTESKTVAVRQAAPVNPVQEHEEFLVSGEKGVKPLSKPIDITVARASSPVVEAPRTIVQSGAKTSAHDYKIQANEKVWDAVFGTTAEQAEGGTVATPESDDQKLGTYLSGISLDALAPKSGY